MPASNEPPAKKPAVPGAADQSDAAYAEASGSIVVDVDEDLSDLIPAFLERKREDACAILAAAEHGEGETIARLGHKLKGEGGGYGLDAISVLGSKLERAAAVRDFAAAAALGRELVGFLDRLEIRYRRMED